jgi:predicted enzyme related to lactoylglutathione lyase
MNRRNILRSSLGLSLLPGVTVLNLGCSADQNSTDASSDERRKGDAMKIQYLEIVTKDVDAACAIYSQMYGVEFGEAEHRLGGARTARLTSGGMLGIRAPLRPTEEPVVRPYVLVNDIKASIAAAAKSEAVIAMEPTEIPGYGQFAIVIHGGIESGLWQLPQ